ncbi:MAG: hypothetical protein JWN78_760 [Bacteroidota bacterium]|nr:hypothetical protein [Bacteroidota bacterium]
MIKFAAVLVIINSICLLLDRIIFLSEKEKLKKALEKSANQLLKINPLNVPQKVLLSFDAFLKKAYGPNYLSSPLFWITISSISILFTSQTAPLSNFIENKTSYDIFLISKSIHGIKILQLLLINLALDLVIWIFFLNILRIVDDFSSPKYALYFVVISLFFILLAAEKRYGVFYSTIYGWNLRNFYLMNDMMEKIFTPYIGIQMFGAFFPFLTFLLLSLITFLLIPFFRLSIWIAKRLVGTLIEQATDRLAPFSLVGAIISVIVAIIKFRNGM